MVDIARSPDVIRKKKIRRIIYGAVALLAIIVITVGVSRLKPAAPSVDRATVWVDTVKRGQMLRQVRGSGTLVPEDIRWISATTAGRVERILLRAGAVVEPNTVILELSSPDVEQAHREAQLAYQSALAAYENRKADLQSALLTQESNVATIEANFSQASLDLEANLQLEKDGLVSSLLVKQKKGQVAELKNRLSVEQKRLEITRAGTKSQLAPQEAEIAQRKAAADLQARRLDDLKVKAGMSGVLQCVCSTPTTQVERGAQVNPGQQPRARRQSEHAQGGTAHRGNADQGHPHRPVRRSRHPQRRRQGQGLAHRPGLVQRHGRRRHHARRRAALRRASGPERRRHGAARGAEQHHLRRPAGVRPGEQLGEPVQGRRRRRGGAGPR